MTAITNLAEVEDNTITRELRANLARYKVEHNPEVAKVAKVDKTEAEVTEVIKIEVMASEVTAPTEETKEYPMTKDDLEEEEEDAGEQGVLMGTSGEPTKTTHIEMLIIWATTMGIPVLYQYSSLILHHHCIHRHWILR